MQPNAQHTFQLINDVKFLMLSIKKNHTEGMHDIIQPSKTLISVMANLKREMVTSSLKL